MTDIIISIVTYKNNFAQLQKVIQSVLNTNLNIKLFISDNSPDESIKQICQDSRVEYIFNQSNIGFGAGHNIIIKKSLELGVKYHLVLNPDIFFENGVLENIFQFMENNQDVGMLQPKIFYPDGSIQHLPKLLPSPLQLLKRKITVSEKLYEKWNSEYELRTMPDNSYIDAPVLSGCFTFIRTIAFGKAGLYDDRYFMYFEDFDLSRRINKYYQTVYYTYVAVYHEYERGAQKNPKLFKIFLKSAFSYFNKWGWLFDKDRRLLNEKTINKIKSIQ